MDEEKKIEEENLDENSEKSEEEPQKTENNDEKIEIRIKEEDTKPAEEHKKHKIGKKVRSENVVIVLGIIVIVVLLVNTVMSAITISKLKEKIGDAKEFSKPVPVNLFVIRDNTCNDCFDVSSIIEEVKKSNVEIINEENIDIKSGKAKEFIGKYLIGKIPAIVVEVNGNISKLESLRTIFDIRDNALIFTKALPPYIDVQTGEVKGRVSVTKLIDSECKDCPNLEQLILQLKQAGIVLSSDKEVDIKTEQGKSILTKYNIKKVPTIILSKDAVDYELIKTNWNSLGVISEDGSYILTTINPPYRDITTNEIKGLVELTYITDRSCSECYNVSEHKLILTNQRAFALAITKETSVDISTKEGKELINNYNITSVPTVLLSKEASAYPSLISVWRNVGSVEKDGILIFRNLDLMQGKYKDLSKNEIIEPKQETVN